MPVSPTYGWPEPAVTGNNDYPGEMKTAFDAVDTSLRAYYPTGLFSARPAAGIPGRTYTCTDSSGVHQGEIDYDNGTGWAQIYPNSTVASGTVLLTQVRYNPTSVATYTSPVTGYSYVDVDGTNLVTPSFASPASGNVKVVFQGFGGPSSGTPTNTMVWSVAVDGLRVAATDAMVYSDAAVGSGAAAGSRITYDAYLTGLSGSHTVKWQWAVSASHNPSGFNIFAGGTTSGGLVVGPAVIEVWSMP